MAYHQRVIPGQPDWKAEVRQRIMGNLEDILRDAHFVYTTKISESRFSSAEAREQYRREYDHEVNTLRNIAEAEVAAAIQREDRERRLAEEAGLYSTENLNRAFVEEQTFILNTIRGQVSTHAPLVQDNEGSIFLEGSSDTARPNFKSGLIPHVPSTCVDVAEQMAGGRREQHAHQQEQYRQRAEEILERKRRERAERRELEVRSQTNFTPMTSCSSSNTSAASDQEKPEDNAPMSEEDVINLMVFHDQQWTFVSSLPHLQWSDFPWPCLTFSGPKRMEDLTPEALGGYVNAQFNIHQNRAIVKEHLKNLIRRWHPDRFEVKYLSRIPDPFERETVRDGAGIVARILNDLLGKWNDP